MKTKMQTRTYKNQFPDWTAPEQEVKVWGVVVSSAPIPELLTSLGFVDNSWHNDTMPNWLHEELKINVWVDYPQNESEFWQQCPEGDFFRFSVYLVDDDFLPVDYEGELFTNDFQDVVNYWVSKAVNKSSK